MSTTQPAERTLQVKPRQTVEKMAVYSPPLEGRRQKTRLDFNENTVGFAALYPEGFATDTYTAYPEYEALIAKLADYLQVPVTMLMLCNGSDEALAVIPSTFIDPKQDTALCCKPTFGMIAHNLTLAEAKLIELPLNADLTYDVAAISTALAQEKPKLAIFASPDNPTGAVLPVEALLSWCKAYPETVFLLDEAYSHFMPEGFTSIPHVMRTPNLVVCQTFSKAWALAGLRLGYVVAHPQIIDWLKRVRSPYSVSMVAVVTALKLLEHTPVVAQNCQDIIERKDRFVAAIREKGYTVSSGGGNFFLVNFGADAAVFTRFCAEQGLLVRNQSHQHLLQGCIRVSTGSEGENHQFLDMLDAWRAQTALVFDLDDTLVDTSQSFDTVVAFLVRKYSQIPLGTKELSILRSEGGYNDDWDATVELLRRRNVEIEKPIIVAEGRRVYLNLAKDVETLLLPLDLLDRLKKRYRLFLFTGRMRVEYDPIWAEELTPYFDAVFCSDDVPNLKKKPSPDYLNHIRSVFNLQHAWYVGNSVDDMACAVQAKFSALGVTQTNTADQLHQAGATLCVALATDLEKVLTP
jgi:histidinol-phosphate aminotransferase